MIGDVVLIGMIDESTGLVQISLLKELKLLTITFKILKGNIYRDRNQSIKKNYQCNLESNVMFS